ncbi:M23 family metallopeptidase [bacterium]|nr:M23 family metallopeptidase [bacterium]
MKFRNREILIIPKGKGNIKKYFMSKNMQLLLTIAVVITGLLAIYFSYDYIHTKSQLSDYVQIVEENQILKSQNEKIAKDLSTVLSSLEKVKVYEEQINNIMGLKTDVKNSKGGPDFYSLYQNNNLKNLTKIRENLITNLTKEISNKEADFIRIKDYILKNNSLIAATPSIWPLKGYISSGFQWRTNPLTGKKEFHKGIDIAGPIGTPLVSTADGIITRAENNPYGYGKLIEVTHGFGFSTRYAHLNSISVKIGQFVKRGQVIGSRGSTGWSTGPHLHYEVRINNKPVNPMNFILDRTLE